jgi:hypothetical protein
MIWWRQYWRLLIAICVSFIGLVVVGLLYIRRQKKAADELAKELQLLQKSALIRGLEADREARRGALSKNEAAALDMDIKIAELKQEVVFIKTNTFTYSLDEAVEEFKRLGY